MIPEHTQAALDRYVNSGIMPGGFLTAVLSNDLFGAVAQADSANLPAIPAIVNYIYNDVPSAAWGSAEKVYSWAQRKG